MELPIAFQCFAPISTFAQAGNVKQYTFYAYEPFKKAGFANRYQVLGSGGMINLSLPVMGGRSFRGRLCDVAIANDKAWQRDHWRTLVSCYNRSAYFAHYAPGLLPFYERPYEQLMAFSLDSFEWVLRQLKVEAEIVVSQETLPVEGRPLTPVNRKDWTMPPYFQVFDRPFESNLSILDLLFNLGPAATQYLDRLNSLSD